MNLHKIIRNSAYYAGCGDDFSLMVEIPGSTNNWVFCDSGGLLQDGYQEMCCGNEKSFWDFEPEGWTRDLTLGGDCGIEDITNEFLESIDDNITDEFLESFGRVIDLYIPTQFGGGEMIQKKVLRAQYNKRGEETRHAIFCLGFEGIALYQLLYPSNGQCPLFILKQGIGTKYGRDYKYGRNEVGWEEALTIAFTRNRRSQPRLIYNWDGWCGLPDAVKILFERDFPNRKHIYIDRNGSTKREEFEIYKQPIGDR